MRLLWGILLLFSSSAWAADYYWVAASQTGPSPDAACRAGMQHLFPSVNYTGYVMTTPSRASCRGGQYSGHYIEAFRGGDSCPPGHTYNASTGECDPPPAPDCTSGEKKDFLVNSADGSLPGSVVSDGCVFNVVTNGENFFCQSSTTGPAFVCAVEAEGTGEANTGPTTDEPVEVTEKPTTTTSNEPCVYVTAGDGTQSCTSSKSVTDSGKFCGSVNGQSVCIGQPSSKTDTVNTNVSTSNNSDGSSTQTKTDVHTKEECKGDTCKTSTTTSTQTTVKDSSGAVQSSSSSCSGPACTKDGSKDGDGDGVEDYPGPETPGLEDVGDYKATTQQFFNSVKGSPLATAIGSIQVPSGGSAPTLSTGSLAAIGGASFDLGIIRDLKPAIDDVLSVAMRAAWSLLAVLIVLSW